MDTVQLSTSQSQRLNSGKSLGTGRYGSVPFGHGPNWPQPLTAAGAYRLSTVQAL